MSVAWPALFLLLPLFWLVMRFRQPKTDAALDHPYLHALAQNETLNGNTQKASLWLHVAWLCLVLALVRPQFVGEPIVQTESGRSLYLAVDLSTSMLEPDMSWNGRVIERYTAVQLVVGEFVRERVNDFIGLVVFGEFAAVQAPLTPDTQALSKLLADLRPGMAGDSTAIGDGLALAVKQLRESDSPDKVIILLSDGENTAGTVTPEEAMTIAEQSDIKVYTIGFGGGRSQGLLGLLGARSGLDEETLKAIAVRTGGEYYAAQSTSDLIDVFNTIDQLEQDERDGQERRQITELYSWPLALGFVLWLIPLLQNAYRTRRANHVS